MTLKRLFTYLSLTLFCVVASAQGGDMKKIAATIEFVVNTDTVIENDRYAHFKEDVIPYIIEHHDDIDVALLVGSASPEGNKTRNEYLADIRAKKMLKLLDGIIPDEKIHVVSDGKLFLSLAKCEQGDYPRRRAARLEIWFKERASHIDTLRLERIDTVYIHDTLYTHDTIYVEKPWRRVPILAVKTNLLSDALITPSIQAELYTWLWGLSLEFDYTFPWFHKDYGTYFYYQILNGTVGIRKYLNNKYTGHYFGVYANTAIYDICPFDKEKGWQGELYGAGISYGYVLQNKRHPRVKFEPYIRFGWFNTKFDTYHASQPWDEKYYYNWYSRASDFVPRRFNMNYFGPTEIGVNFTFDLICLRRY